MPPRREGGGLFGDPQRSLARLQQFVAERVFAGCESDWQEVVRAFSDGEGFVEGSAWRRGERVRVLIEAGVQRDGERRVVGFFDAAWDSDQQEFESIEAVVVEGMACSVETFVDRFEHRLEWPLEREEVRRGR